MGDRTYFQLKVHACPEEQLDALAVALNPVGDGCWLLTTLHGDEDQVERINDASGPFPWELAIDEVSCGWVDEIDTDELVAAAPGAIWELWEDPKYEWLGHWLGYSPATGVISGECDADGVLQVDLAEGRSILEALPDVDGLIERAAAIAALFPQAAFRAEVQRLEETMTA
jgi:hypothetical protein